MTWAVTTVPPVPSSPWTKTSNVRKNLKFCKAGRNKMEVVIQRSEVEVVPHTVRTNSSRSTDSGNLWVTEECSGERRQVFEAERKNAMLRGKRGRSVE